MISFKPILSRRFILESYSQEEIFKTVFNREIRLDQKYRNPFRADSNPGCYFSYKNGKLYFYDWAANMVIDCFGAVMLDKKVNFFEALKVIHGDLNLNSCNQSLEVNRTTGSTFTSNLIAATTTMTRDDYQWWSSFGINYSLLEKETFNENLTKASNVYKKINSFNQYEKVSLTGDTYILKPTSSKGIKVYSPNCTKKWLSTLKRNDIFGLSELPRSGEILIIASSYKDMLTIKSQFGLPCIAAQSESYFPEELVRNLKERFKTIILFYDLDNSGIANAYRISNKYEFDKIFVPDNRFGVKDPSDFCKIYSPYELRSNMFIND